MKLSKRVKTLLIIGLIIIGLYQGGKYTLNRFIYKHLPELIAEKNDTPYNFTYEDIEYSPALRRLTVSGITVTPKDTITHKNTTYIKGHLDNIVIQGVAIKELFKTKNLKANKIKLNTLDIVVIQGDTVVEQPKEVNITNIIDINTIAVNNAHIVIKNRANHTRLNEVYNFNADITGVHFAQEVKEKGLPFSYEGYTMSCDSVYNKLNDWHKLTLGKVIINPTSLEVNQVSIESFSKTVNSNNLEKNLLSVNIPKVSLTGTDWGYRDEKHFYLQIGKIETDSTAITIKNNKLKEDITIAEQQPKKGKKKNAKKSNTPIVKVVDTIPSLVPFDLQIGDIKINKLSLDALDTWKTEKMNISISKIVNKAGEQMEINKLLIDSPKITLTPNQVKKKPSNKTKLLMDRIKLDTLVVNKGAFAIHQRKGDKHTLNIADVNATILNIEINDKTSLNKIPFSYDKTKFTTGAIKYDTQKYYDITADNLSIDNKDLKLTNFVMKPKYSRKKTVSMFRYADDIFTLNAKEITLKDYKWDFDKAGVLLFKTELLNINQLDANIFRDKSPTFNMSIKPMFSKKLRDIPFGLQVNTVAIKNSKLVYEETDKNAVAPGKIMFHNFNATIKNVYSGYGQTKVPTTSIAVNARFMNAAPLRVDWTFNVLNRSDQFNIQGKITNFPANSMHPFLQPYIKASTQGSISLVTFNFSGNNRSATGTYGMKYEDLRVTIYKKDGEKKKKFLSAVGNMFIRKSTKDEVKTVNIKTVDRVQEKSFFNYLWLCIMQGLKQTVL
ncbi:DUF748 domain-containing protein [Myroides marinus]|uniref:DUF748 domain-containing protein n=1 Tax=Myroides marinus TaxID=703342 RepID=UPI00257623BB|nr:DUF748 domain-containing protein [Myroides marinus]MDM1371818.1 DUF748 domain-containing protein [Myroides marinus]MDM1390080.1 DUF748 domain-containing protein [Myroides marinus]MDM1403728.1 DUF748 domain-containing protein [Myroides marinus]MDM1534333.1 DUF748 domain-containing protein [Myroides marinus]MDM1541297.1 DUF748 domain-containing protein [Myroides marinus]